MNGLVPLAAVASLAVQPLAAQARPATLVMAYAICGEDGARSALVRIPLNRQHPLRDREPQAAGCAHALRPKGPALARTA